ncbi:MAG: TolC family protein [Proteobacteria bacterium]|nr:TolC family protein [Pseudomonadota bacterium]
MAEAQIAWREVDSAYQTVISAAEAIRAARTDLLQNEARWNSFALVEGDFSDGQNPTTLLDQLLDAQQRLSNAELTYSQSLLEFKRSEVELKRATGELLNHQEVSSIGYSTPWQSGEVIPTPDPHSQNLPPSGNLPVPAQR